MPNSPIQWSAAAIDFSARVVQSTSVVASPALAAETTICTITIPSAPALITGVILFGWCAFTVGTSGVSANLKIRQTGTSGSTVVATGAQTVTAAGLIETGCQGLDVTPATAGVYVLTLTIASGAAPSTVSATQLFALLV